MTSIDGITRAADALNTTGLSEVYADQIDTSTGLLLPVVADHPLTDAVVLGVKRISVPTANGIDEGTVSAVKYTDWDSRISNVTGVMPVQIGTSGNSRAVSMNPATTMNDGYMTSALVNEMKSMVASTVTQLPLRNNGTATAVDLSVDYASTTSPGILSSTGYTALINKVTTVTVNSPLVDAGTIQNPNLSITKATPTTDGYVSKEDYTTFSAVGGINATYPLKKTVAGGIHDLSIERARPTIFPSPQFNFPGYITGDDMDNLCYQGESLHFSLTSQWRTANTGTNKTLFASQLWNSFSTSQHYIPSTGNDSVALPPVLALVNAPNAQGVNVPVRITFSRFPVRAKFRLSVLEDSFNWLSDFWWIRFGGTTQLLRNYCYQNSGWLGTTTGYQQPAETVSFVTAPGAIGYEGLIEAYVPAANVIRCTISISVEVTVMKRFN